jgi:hypothetical protein
MRKVSVLNALLIMTLVTASVAQTATCSCGPDFCLNGPNYSNELKARKAAMEKHKYPSDLIALMDLDGACIARVDRAPVTFRIKLVNSDGSSSTIEWTDDDERIARKDLLSGKLKSYYKFNVSRAFKCCGEPSYDKRADWDATLELNLKLAIACSKVGNDVVCKRGQ